MYVCTTQVPYDCSKSVKQKSRMHGFCPAVLAKNCAGLIVQDMKTEFSGQRLCRYYLFLDLLTAISSISFVNVKFSSVRSPGSNDRVYS
jgi:hypothetical protein